MRDREFEAYLELLSRLLKLDRRQREEIRREIEAHVAEALEEELARGLTREQAIWKILEDFGDAAELAERFSGAARKRRYIMQGTLAAACVGIVALSVTLLRPVVWTAGGGSIVGVQSTSVSARPAERPEFERVLRLLETRFDPSFEDVPLEQVLASVRDSLKINVLVHWDILAEHGVDRTRPVSMSLRQVSYEQFLELLFETLPDVELGFEIRDGVLVISTEERLNRTMLTEVYDVRDILTMATQWQRMRIARPPALTQNAEPFGDEGGTREEPQEPELAEDALIDLVTRSVSPDSWDVNGGRGGISAYAGTLVVRNQRRAQADVARLLDDLRRVTSSAAVR